MQKKKLFFIILGILLIFAFIISILFFYTYSISGKITDLANKEPISNIEVSIANIVDKTNKDGLFQIKNIKIYQREVLKIEVPVDYEEIPPIFLEYNKRDIIRNIELVPTLEIMVDRINIAVRNVQHDYLWNYMHPDDQQYWESKDNYTKTFKQLSEIRAELGGSASEHKIEKNIRKLDQWKQKITGKEYANIMEVPIEVKTIYDGKEQTQIDLTYWQKIDGVWRYFTKAEKEESKKMIEAYEELKDLFSE
jgi:hypothetical protein